MPRPATRAVHAPPLPGVADVRIRAADEVTAGKVQAAIAAAWATSGGSVYEDGRRYVQVDTRTPAPPRAEGGAVSAQGVDPAHTAHLRAGRRITAEEIALHVSAAAVLLLQVARAAETPAEAVEYAGVIEQLNETGRRLAEHGEKLSKVADITADRVPLAVDFGGYRCDPWGLDAVASDRQDYGGPATIPSVDQLLLLADLASGARKDFRDEPVPTRTWSQGMDQVPGRAAFESRAAFRRREAERNAAVAARTLELPCERCDAGPGQHCTTTTGRTAEQPHRNRAAEAARQVDDELNTLGAHPLARRV